MDVKGKSKDNEKARNDLELFCCRSDFHLIELTNEKWGKPKANYTLSSNDKASICKWIRELKMPDGYASNIVGVQM